MMDSLKLLVTYRKGRRAKHAGAHPALSTERIGSQRSLNRFRRVELFLETVGSHYNGCWPSCMPPSSIG